MSSLTVQLTSACELYESQVVARFLECEAKQFLKNLSVLSAILVVVVPRISRAYGFALLRGEIASAGFKKGRCLVIILRGAPVQENSVVLKSGILVVKVQGMKYIRAY